MSYIKAIEPTPALDELGRLFACAVVAEHGKHLRCGVCGGPLTRPIVSAKVDLVGSVVAADLRLRCGACAGVGADVQLAAEGA